MKNKYEECLEKSRELLDFIQKSPTAFHAIASMKNILETNGFVRLREEDAWQIEPHGKYYVTRNGSSLVAIDVGAFAKDTLHNESYNFHLTASHSDSPAFKIKEKPVLHVMGKYTQLNTEGYGGMLCAPWLDRPLSIAGRAIVKNGDAFETKLVCFERDLLLIPNLAIHMNREANNGLAYNKQIDLLPLISGGKFSEEDFMQMLATELGTASENILGTDLFLYNRSQPAVWGATGEFISSPRLDDLQCAFACLHGFLNGAAAEKQAEKNCSINVYACLDNEEVGSVTKQGAAAAFVANVLLRVNNALGKSEEDFRRAAASSLMLSADNAHAVHPNHPEKTDAANHAFINEGVVIKSHAGQKYTSDAVSIAAFKEICRMAQVPFQFFANRSDAAGGSTLGNISMTQLAVNCVDIGLPQLAMHSPYETAGVYDTSYMIAAVTEFYKSKFAVCGDGFCL